MTSEEAIAFEESWFNPLMHHESEPAIELMARSMWRASNYKGVGHWQDYREQAKDVLRELHAQGVNLRQGLR